LNRPPSRCAAPPRTRPWDRRRRPKSPGLRSARCSSTGWHATCELRPGSTIRKRHCNARPPLRHETLLVMSSPGMSDHTEFFNIVPVHVKDDWGYKVHTTSLQELSR
jgi:hypothetical protein